VCVRRRARRAGLSSRRPPGILPRVAEQLADLVEPVAHGLRVDVEGLRGGPGLAVVMEPRPSVSSRRTHLTGGRSSRGRGGAPRGRRSAPARPATRTLLRCPTVRARTASALRPSHAPRRRRLRATVHPAVRCGTACGRRRRETDRSTRGSERDRVPFALLARARLPGPRVADHVPRPPEASFAAPSSAHAQPAAVLDCVPCAKHSTPPGRISRRRSRGRGGRRRSRRRRTSAPRRAHPALARSRDRREPRSHPSFPTWP
jgi:hypothetical protein